MKSKSIAKKKVKKRRSKTYQPKLKVSGKFIDVLNAAVKKG